MNFSLDVSTWRVIKLYGALIVSGVFFTVSYLIINLFFVDVPVWALPLLYLLCASLALLIVGNTDSATQRWYQSQLLSTRELFATLYDQSPVPYLTLDGRGVITMCNLAAGRLFQRNTTDLLGQPFAPYITHSDDNKLSVILGTLKAGATLPQTEAQLKIRNGQEVIWVHVSVFHSERFNQQLITLVDINTQKLIDKAKSEFVSLATHQLRTPITAIKWNIDLLARSGEPSFTEKQLDYLEKAKRNVARMIALINDFLSVSKLETGTFATTLVPLQVADYLATIIDQHQQAVQEKNITLSTSFEPPALTITTDEPLFHIIVSNLLSNAVKYTRENGTVFLGYQQAGDKVIVTVQDSGIGIPAHELDNLFKKFFRASNAQLYRTEGTGLGLYVVKESAEKLGGMIAVESAENVGTRFVVTLPVAAPAQ